MFSTPLLIRLLAARRAISVSSGSLSTKVRLVKGISKRDIMGRASRSCCTRRLEMTMSPTFRPSAKAPAVPMKNRSVTPNSCIIKVAVIVAATLPHLEKATTQRMLPNLPTTNSRFAIFKTVFSVSSAFTSSISCAIAPRMPMFLIMISSFSKCKGKKYYLCKKISDEENLHFLWQQHGLRPDLQGESR